jgi:pyruvate dehydrogenase E1 component alpha subunit
VGVCSALGNKEPFEEFDLVYSSRRPTGHAITKGVDMKKMAAENDFRSAGINGGYACEMHLFDKSCGFIGADGMIGAGHVIATGSAFAFRARGSKQVAVVFAGEGTSIP